MSRFWRNLSRVLRGNAGGDVMIFPALAIITATGVLTFTITHSVGASGIAGLLSLPIQLGALANRSSAYAVAAVGSLLVGATVAVLPVLLILGPLGWLVGLSAGGLSGWLMFRHYQKVIRTINDTDPTDWL